MSGHSAESDAPTPCGYGTATCRKYGGCDAVCAAKDRVTPPAKTEADQ